MPLGHNAHHRRPLVRQIRKLSHAVNDQISLCPGEGRLTLGSIICLQEHFVYQLYVLPHKLSLKTEKFSNVMVSYLWRLV